MKFFFVGLFLFFFYPRIYAQQTQIVNYKTLIGTVSFQPKVKAVQGELTVTFQCLQNTDSIYLDAKNMEVTLKRASSKKIHLKITPKKVWFLAPFKAGRTYSITLKYNVQNPKKTLYFVGWNNKGSNQIWSQGEGHYTSYWLPSIDDKNDKIIFDLTYKVPQSYTVIGNGKRVEHQTTTTQEIWHYQMRHPMSSYLVAVVVGHYNKKSLTSSSGKPIELYFEPKFSAKVEPTYRYSKQIFDFLEKEIGVAYPWVNYKQIPVRNFLYAGMENTTATIFAESFFTDSIGFIDHNYVNVNAHELAHQWFGDLVTEHTGADHWLQEGFATYYALLADRQIFGDDYFYLKLYQSAEKLKARSDKGKGQALINPKANSLTFYQKGAWALHILREKIGNEAFKAGMQAYLKKYAFKNATVTNFIAEMEKSSGQDLTEFVNDWIKQTAFQAKDALASLKKSAFIKKYMQIIALRKIPLKEKYTTLDQALNFPSNKYIGQEVVNQLASETPSPKRLQLYKKAFNTQNTLIRQAIASTLTKIPKALQAAYEGLLKDPSYLTQEQALFNLWKNFPDKRKIYLNTLQNTQGFYSKNVRLLWLTLSLVTQEYRPQKKQVYYKELSGYTAPAYDYSIRQGAFMRLYQLNLFSTQNYKDLLQACEHPVWRFRSFAQQLLGRLLKDNDHRKRLQKVLPQLSSKEQNILKKAFQKQHENNE